MKTTFCNCFSAKRSHPASGQADYIREKAMPGQLCRVRIGKVNPLNNEIQLLAVEEY
jgi:hypothetical protein